MKEWYVEIWEKNLCKFAADEVLEYNKALAIATVVTDMISLTLCTKIQVTKQAMYVRRTIQSRLYNCCCSRKAIIVTYPECV